MISDELSTSDVLTDPSKNLANIYHSNEDDEADVVTLLDNQYYTETDFCEFVKDSNLSKTDNLIILSINIANLFSKLNSFKAFLQNISNDGPKPDIITVVETHINETTNHGLDSTTLSNIIPGYQFFHKGRKNKRGGGIGIFVSNDINAEPKLCDATARKLGFIEEQFENLVVKIPDCISCGFHGRKKDLIIATIYRQPNYNNLENFQNCIETLLSCIDKPKNEIIITGDMNLDLLKYENHLPTSKYLDTMTEHQLLPRIIRPSRIKSQSATLIDHIFTRNNGLTLVSGIVEIELSGSSGYTDHMPVFTILQTSAPRKKMDPFINLSFFTPEGHQKRKEGLMSHDWNPVLTDRNPDSIYDSVISIYGHHYHNNLTTRRVKRNPRRFKREPWMTDDILSDIRKRDRLCKIKGRRDEYKKLRNEIVSKIRKAQRSHFEKQIQDNIGDIKKHWKILKGVINKLSNKRDITTDFLLDLPLCPSHPSKHPDP